MSQPSSQAHRLWVRLLYRPGLASPDQGSLYCSAHSGKPSWDSSIGQTLPGTKAFHLVWLLFSLKLCQTWPRVQGQLRNQNKLCQLWDAGHQPLIIVIPSHHLKLGIWKNLIYAYCPVMIINRIFIHSEKYHPIWDVRPHSSSLVMYPLGFMYFTPLIVGIFCSMTSQFVY